jgi:hypothetical protein
VPDGCNPTAAPFRKRSLRPFLEQPSDDGAEEQPVCGGGVGSSGSPRHAEHLSRMTSRARDYVESSGRCSSAASFPKGAEGVINQRDLDPHPERFLAGVVRSGGRRHARAHHAVEGHRCTCPPLAGRTAKATALVRIVGAYFVSQPACASVLKDTRTAHVQAKSGPASYLARISRGRVREPRGRRARRALAARTSRACRAAVSARSRPARP